MVHRRNLLLGGIAALAAAAAPIPFASPARSIELRDVLSQYSGEIDPHLPPYSVRGDALQGSNGAVDGNTFSLNVYTFTAADIGKTIYCDAFGGARTLTALVAGNPNAVTFSGTAAGAASGRGFIFGSDDTAGWQAAVDDARYGSTGVFTGDPTAAVGNRNFGRLVRMRSGRLYLIGNTSAQYNAGAGRLGALVLHRRTGVVGSGAATSAFVIAPGSYGYGVVNDNATTTGSNNAFCDFMTFSKTAVFGAKGFGQANMLGLFRWSLSFQGYDYTDAWNTSDDLLLVDAPGDGLYVSGRGEFMFSRIRSLNAAGYGMTLSTVDSSFVQLSSGGASKGGIRVYSNPNTRISNAKAWYSGKGGGTSYEDCANWVVDADQAKNGVVAFDNCEGQEARGSGWVIKTGYCTFRACRTQDAGQANGLDGGAALPDIRAGVHLFGSGCIENDIDIFVQAGVRIFSSTSTFLGTHALYVAADAANNRGSVEAMGLLSYTGRAASTGGFARPDTTKLGGPGVSNGKNTRLLMDGVALT